MRDATNRCAPAAIITANAPRQSQAPYCAACAAKYRAGGCPKLRRNIATKALTLA